MYSVSYSLSSPRLISSSTSLSSARSHHTHHLNPRCSYVQRANAVLVWLNKGPEDRECVTRVWVNEAACPPVSQCEADDRGRSPKKGNGRGIVGTRGQLCARSVEVCDRERRDTFSLSESK